MAPSWVPVERRADGSGLQSAPVVGLGRKEGNHVAPQTDPMGLGRSDGSDPPCGGWRPGASAGRSCRKLSTWRLLADGFSPCLRCPGADRDQLPGPAPGDGLGRGRAVRKGYEGYGYPSPPQVWGWEDQKRMQEIQREAWKWDEEWRRERDKKAAELEREAWKRFDEQQREAAKRWEEADREAWKRAAEARREARKGREGRPQLAGGGRGRGRG